MRRHRIVLAAASSCVVTSLVGGIAWAAIPGDGGVISACYGKVGGVVRVIDVAKGEKCIPALEVPISWNQKGQKGDTGLPGAPGAPGTNGSNGSNGVSPTVGQLAAGDPNCPAGGAAITDAHGSTAFVCSGQNGQPFAGTFTSPSGEYSISVTDGGISLARGGSPVVQITGASIEITGQNVAIVSALDASLDAGRNAIISTGQTAVISTGRDASISSSRNFTVQSGSQTSLQSAGATSVQSSATVALSGTQVLVNGSGTCAPAARAGDAVNSAQIVTGSTTVCIG